MFFNKEKNREAKIRWKIEPETGEKRKSHYTCRESRVYIEFPYTPKTEYVYRESGAEG